MTISAALLHPGNRLLSGGTTDFAMFGGQPAAVAVAAPDGGDAGFVTAFADDGTGQAVASVRNAALPDRIYTGPPAPTTPPLDDAGARSPGFHGEVPHLFSGGSSTTVPTESAPLSRSPLVLDDAAFGGQSGPIDGTGNPFQTAVLDVAAPVLAADAFALTVGTAGAPFVPVLAGTAAVTGVVETIAAETIGTAAALDGPILPAGEIAGVTASLPGGIDTALSPVTASTAQITATIEGATTLAAAQDSVAATVLPLVDHLAGTADPSSAATDVLAGTDPAAGIATLTGMVGSADVFELTGDGMPAAPDPVASVLDHAPAVGEAASPLLGDHDDTPAHLGDLTHQPDPHLGIGGL